MTNEDKAKAIIESTFPHLWMIKEAMDRLKLPEVDLLRMLYLVENTQKISGWGKVTITVKNGEVIAISGENNFISENELMRNLKKYQER